MAGEIAAATPTKGHRYQYHITGNVAHRRIAPLLTKNGENSEWMDHKTGSSESTDASCHPVSSEPTTVATSAAAVAAAGTLSASVDFLWENAPRHDTKSWRDRVKCYSHLPNGTAILDSKWVLGRLLGSVHTAHSTATSATAAGDCTSSLAVLETHCFRGSSGFTAFTIQVGLSPSQSPSSSDDDSPPQNDKPVTFRDLMDDDPTIESVVTSAAVPDPLDSNHRPSTTASPSSSMKSPNLWVVKDAHANGAGGIWVVGPDSNLSSYQDILTEGHWYVAQRYAWPPVLFRRRKCHVRVYALLTADGRAHVHRRCFVHVANDIFGEKTALVEDPTEARRRTTTSTTNPADTDPPSDSKVNPYPDSMHITNCCANSHDLEKFAGEICADLEATEHVWKNPSSTCDADLTVGLEAFAPSIYASVAALARATFPFVRGGDANGGFEYLGLDFILSYRARCSTVDDSNPSFDDDEPVAYLLEVNAPPSQDTATGLPHAEDLHDCVIRDLLTLWVIPNVTRTVLPRCGGWRCVYESAITLNDNGANDVTSIPPSKAAILNRIRWTLYERKCLAAANGTNDKANVAQHQHGRDHLDGNAVASFARTMFPYYSLPETKVNTSSVANPIYLENAGGTQVPQTVVDALVSSIRCRHRSVHGKASVAAAKSTMATIIGASPSEYTLSIGQNASSLLATLAQRYVEACLLKEGDEILISSDNHAANVEPWLRAAQLVGAIVKWWDPDFVSTKEGHKQETSDPTMSTQFQTLLSTKTRIVAIPHASNIVGKLYDLFRLRALVDEATQGHGHIVADGVAAVPHRWADLDTLQLDWYVVSCHKLFGPHLGMLCGRTSVTELLSLDIETGTMNYEACEGVYGLGLYMRSLSTLSDQSAATTNGTMNGDSPHVHNDEGDVTLDRNHVLEAYRRIGLVEAPLVRVALQGLSRSTKVHVVHGSDSSESRLPVVCFVHHGIPCHTIVEHCRQGGIACRHGSFLSTQRLQALLPMGQRGGLGPGGDETNTNEWQVVRFSLSHYNTVAEVHCVLAVLESIPDWF